MCASSVLCASGASAPRVSSNMVGVWAAALGLPLVGVVNNAGVARGPTPIEFHDLMDVRAMFDTNVFGAMALTQAGVRGSMM